MTILTGRKEEHTRFKTKQLQNETKTNLTRKHPKSMREQKSKKALSEFPRPVWEIGEKKKQNHRQLDLSTHARQIGGSLAVHDMFRLEAFVV